MPFGSDPNVIGKTVHISGIECHVVGVAPPGFQFPDNTELWVPFEAFPDDGSDRSGHNYSVVGRLKSGVSLATAQAELDTIARRLEQQYPESNKGQGVTVLTLHQQLVGDVQPALLILLGAVGFVLLIACANVANLLLARSAARSREMAVRAALGAGRARLMRQVLTESLLLSAIGGAVGLLLAVWAMPVLKMLIPASVPRADEIGIDAAGTLVYARHLRFDRAAVRSAAGDSPLPDRFERCRSKRPRAAPPRDERAAPATCSSFPSWRFPWCC